MIATRLCRPLTFAALLVPGVASAADAPPAPATGALVVHFRAVRSAKGMIRACLTRDVAHYMDCGKDPAAFKANVAAGPAAQADFADLPPGDYVLIVAHDENGNGKIDTMLGIPREGVGFSRDAPMHFGPPKAADARFHVAPGANDMTVTLRYFL